LDEKKVFTYPQEKRKTSKKSLFLRDQIGGQKFFFTFFLCGGVLGTHKRGCAKFAPFWMKKKNIGTPHVIKSPFLSKSNPKKISILCTFNRTGYQQDSILAGSVAVP
jgi:hypothetical protein